MVPRQNPPDAVWIWIHEPVSKHEPCFAVEPGQRRYVGVEQHLRGHRGAAPIPASILAGDQETGVTIRAGEPVFCFDAIVREPSGKVRFHYVITDVLADYVDGEPVANDDALDARWVAADELDNLTVSKITLELLRDRLSFGT